MTTTVAHAKHADLLAILGWQQRRPVARIDGGEWCGPCPWCGGDDRFRAWPHAERGGRWWCRRCARHGDAITLARELGGLSFTQAVQSLANVPSLATKPMPKTDNIPAARHIWNAAIPITDTLAETYLHGRGITITSPFLRFDPALQHGPSGRTFPALVAAIADATGTLTAIHRTYLAADGNGKANVTPNKMMLGGVRGAGVWLAPPAAVMAVAEGIETGLSILQATGIATVCALSASNFNTLMLSPITREVVIAADADEAGQKAADDAAKRWTSSGVTVYVATPENGDFNDVLTKGGPA